MIVLFITDIRYYLYKPYSQRRLFQLSIGFLLPPPPPPPPLLLLLLLLLLLFKTPTTYPVCTCSNQMQDSSSPSSSDDADSTRLVRRVRKEGAATTASYAHNPQHKTSHSLRATAFKAAGEPPNPTLNTKPLSFFIPLFTCFEGCIAVVVLIALLSSAKLKVSTRHT